MADKDKLPSPLERPDVFDGFDGTPAGYANPIKRTAYVQTLMERKQRLGQSAYVTTVKGLGSDSSKAYVTSQPTELKSFVKGSSLDFSKVDIVRQPAKFENEG